MSVYRNIVEAVEDAIFQHQYQSVAQVSWYVEWWTGIRNVNPREIEKIVAKVTTAYKTKA